MPRRYRVSWGRCHVCGLHQDVVDIPNRPDHWNYSLPLPVCQECLADALKAFPKQSKVEYNVSKEEKQP